MSASSIPKMAALGLVLGLGACERKAGEQNARIDAIELGEAKKVRFPVVRTGDAKTSDKINQDLKVRFFGTVAEQMTTDSALRRWADGWGSEVDFNVTLQKNGIASIHLNVFRCDIICSGWSNHFTYSTVTGERLGIGQIVDTVGEFRARVLADRKSRYNQGRMAFLQKAKDEASGASTEELEWAKREYDACAESVGMGSFVLYPDSLVILDPCMFPNAIQVVQPDFPLTYRYAEIRQHLRLSSLR